MFEEQLIVRQEPELPSVRIEADFKRHLREGFSVGTSGCSCGVTAQNLNHQQGLTYAQNAC